VTAIYSNSEDSPQRPLTIQSTKTDCTMFNLTSVDTSHILLFCMHFQSMYTFN